MVAMGAAVKRWLRHGQVKVPADEAQVERLKKRRLNYKGEEIGTCHKLTLAQVKPSLPPVEHGGAIDILDFVTPHTRELLLNPQWSILPDDGRALPRFKGIIHAVPGEVDAIADELCLRGVCIPGFQWLGWCGTDRPLC